MMKLLSLLVVTTIILQSCQKEGSSSNATQTSTSFQAKIDGTMKVFNIESATLIRAPTTNQKRVDISAVTVDGTARLIITLGENTSAGNAMSVKTYTVRLFNDDNPSTTFDESDESDDAFFNYSTKVGGNWLTEVYSENGEVAVSACNSSTTTISGTFKGVSVNLTGGANLTITDGKFDNIKYLVVN